MNQRHYTKPVKLLTTVEQHANVSIRKNIYSIYLHKCESGVFGLSIYKFPCLEEIILLDLAHKSASLCQPMNRNARSLRD